LLQEIADMSQALLFLDPYNDFLSVGGKLWPLVEQVANQVGLHANLKSVLGAVRKAGWPVFVVPHHRSEPGDLDNWQRPTPYQQGAIRHQVFQKGSWGGEWHPEFAPQPGDIVCKEHWNSSGFANTDLDLLLRQRGITHVVMIGLMANTCIETTAKFAAELGYHVTLVRDATAAASHEAMHAAHEINGPTYAHAIVTAQQFREQLNKEA
jgi:nicotinamidase-related amidase